MNNQESPQPPDYLARIGLHREPFAAAPDPAFFCSDSALTQHLDMMHNLTEFGMLTLVVIGEKGIGKTSMLHEYLEHASSNWLVCHLAAEALGNAHTLIKDLSDGFDVESADFVQLVAHLDQMHAQGQLAVLVVDDAERLPEATLRTLLELSGAADDTGKRLRLVLFGAPGLQQRLEALNPELTGNTHVFKLAPLGELQTAAYLQHRLRVAGQQEGAVFSPAQVKSIVKATGGIPALINLHAQKVLIDKFSTASSARNGSRAPAGLFGGAGGRGVWVAAAAVGVLMIIAALWPRPDTQTDEPTRVAAESAAPVATTTVELPLPQAEPPAATAAAGADAAPAEQLPIETVAPLPVPTLGPEVTDTGPMSSSGKIGVSSVPAPEAVPAPDAAGTVAEPETPVTTVTVPAVAAPAAKAAPPPAPTRQAAKPATTAPVIAKPAPAPKPVASAAAATTVKGVSSSQGNAWLKTQRPGDYTLQIMGGTREAAIRRYAQDHRLTGPAAILRTSREGKPWYILVYGAYPSRAAANEALTQLPAPVRTAKPWLRSIAAVQADIAKQP